MSLKENIYNILVVSASENFNNTLLSILLESPCYNPQIVSDISTAKREYADRAYDFIIINSPLPDDSGIRFAIDSCSVSDTAVLLMVRNDIHDEIYDKVAPHGVFTLPKPTTRQMMLTALGWMATTRVRLQKSQRKTLSIEEKMEEIRLVNRAKWMLIRELSMSEPEAHRYIEKQAMDRCVTKRELAEDIIKTYS